MADAEATKPAEMSAGKGALIWVAMLGGAAVLVVVAFGLLNPAPTLSPSERIAQSCERQFGTDGPAAVNECRLRLSVETLGQREQDRMDAARRDAR